MIVPTGKAVLGLHFYTLSKTIQELNLARDAMLRAIFDHKAINPQNLRQNDVFLSEHAICKDHLASISAAIRKHTGVSDAVRLMVSR